jgi:hypothetical protein
MGAGLVLIFYLTKLFPINKTIFHQNYSEVKLFSNLFNEKTEFAQTKKEN